MNSLIKRIIAVITVCLVTALVGCSDKPISNYKSGEYLELESCQIAENDNYTLNWNEEKSAVWLYDKNTGLYFSNLPQEKNISGENKSNHPQLESPILVKYLTDQASDIQTAVTFNDCIKTKSFKAEKSNNALRVTYYFDSLEISVPVIYSLKDEGLSVTIDADGIKEGKTRVFAISVMPFTCSVANTLGKEAYLFVPSGSGALIYPQEIKGGMPIQYSEEVYGTDPQRYYEVETKKTETQSVRMPVYGAWNGQNGIMAIIEDAADSASIDATVGAMNLGYSSVYATFKLRDYQIIKTTIGSKDKQAYVYSKDRRGGKLSVLFHPLSADESGYSGMARVYGKYLDKNYDFSKNEEQLYSLKVVGGDSITENFLGVPKTRLSAMTTLKDAENMIELLKKETGIYPAVNLVGFGESGLSVGKIAGGFKIGKAFGSSADLKGLLIKAKDENIPLYIDFDIQAFSKSGAGINTLSSKATGANLKSVYQYDYSIWSRVRDKNVKKWMLLKRSKTLTVAKKLLNAAEDIGLNGISLTSLSSVAYSDFSSTEYYAKANSAKDGAEIYTLFNNKGIKTAGANANIYAAVLSNQVFDVPLKSSDFDSFDETVPFYSMVLKGRTSLSSSPINLSANPQKAFLSCVETGIGLGFAAAKNYNTDYMKADARGLYGIDYEYASSLIKEQTAEYEDVFEALKGKFAENHKILADGVTETTFTGGATVTVNATDKDVTVNGKTVKAYSFIFMKGGTGN